jgi:hypothetical protein
MVPPALQKTTMLGCYPEIAPGRLVNGLDASVSRTPGMEFLEFLAIIPEQARLGSHPQISFGILEQAS